MACAWGPARRYQQKTDDLSAAIDKMGSAIESVKASNVGLLSTDVVQDTVALAESLRVKGGENLLQLTEDPHAYGFHSDKIVAAAFERSERTGILE